MSFFQLRSPYIKNVAPAAGVPQTYFQNLTASLSPGGAISLSTVRAFTASIAMSGVLTRAARRAFTASLSPAGTLVKQLSRGLTAAMASSGAFTKQTLRSLAAGVASSGVVTNTKVSLLSLTASLSPSGLLSKLPKKSLTASVSPGGVFTKLTIRSLTASVTPAGALAKKALRAFVASLSPSGAISRRAGKALTAGMASGGSISRLTRRNLTASVTPSGAISKLTRRAVSAGMSFIGSLTSLFGTNGTQYYVSATGNDSNNGTSTGTPWLTLAKVTAASLVPGDTVSFKGGDTFSGQLTVPASGSSSKRITFNSYGTGNATISNTAASAIQATDRSNLNFQNLIITGGPTAKGNGSNGITLFRFTAGTSSNITVDNCTISQFSNGISIGSPDAAKKLDSLIVSNCVLHDNRDAGLLTYGQDSFTGANYCVTNITVQNCTAYNNLGNSSNTTSNSGNGIVLGRVQTGLIDVCTAYGNGSLNACASEGPVGLWCYYSDSVVIQKSLSYNNGTGTIADGDGFDLDLSVTNSTIQYCLSYGNMGAGILVYGAGAGNTVRYNITWGNGTNVLGTPFGEFAVGSTTGSAAVYNNTFIARDGHTNPSVAQIGGTPSGLTFRNNILYGGTGYTVEALSGFTTGQFLAQQNDYFRNGGINISWNSAVYTSLSAWRTATSQEKLSGVDKGLNIDPGFHAFTAPSITSASNLTTLTGLELQDTSGLIGQGMNLNSVFGTSVGVRDYFNTALGSVFDIGASVTHAATQSIFTPMRTTIKAAIKRIVDKGSGRTATDAGQSRIATVSGDATIREITANTKNTTVNEPTNQTNTD